MRGRDSGSAVTEFVLVSVLLVFVFFAVLQVAVFWYLRSIVSAATASGAHRAAVAGASAADGGRWAQELIGQGSSARFARGISCSSRLVRDPAGGMVEVVVRCDGQLRSSFLPIGAVLRVDVSAHALAEGQR